MVEMKEKKEYNGRMNEKEKLRLNKFLSQAGVCSRREADRLIEAGRVTVNGQIAVTGEQVEVPGSLVAVDGKPVTREEERILLLFHKPRGIVCTAERRKGQTNVEEYLRYPHRVTYVGRLDKDSQGLLLLTNCGEIINKIMRAGNYHEKEYEVTVDRPVTGEFVEAMSQGVPVLDTVTRPCQVIKTGAYTFRIILTQGLNRQIRRMCEYFGYHVTTLKRIRIMNFHLGDLPEGGYREATQEEWRLLETAIAGSSNTTVIETGGQYGHHPAEKNEGAGRQAQSGSKGLLPGRQRDYEQSGVRRSVSRAGGAGRSNRNRSGRKPHNQGRL